jgi:hypothetical protein
MEDQQAYSKEIINLVICGNVAVVAIIIRTIGVNLILFHGVNVGQKTVAPNVIMAIVGATTAHSGAVALFSVKGS